ncbi:hypothetical protein UFOVP1106_23 [uncultured Caudovirales phage]|uniref:Uncharacterized protein n=1 Tax=uncultured Caudovirales phage TaxID=2100421 RepID=A0A6J5QGZ2_9CAUD|nr:hypothetical protein UFOVP1106_23 [uncultured Caudovirales phage]
MKGRFILTKEQAETLRNMDYAKTEITPNENPEFSDVVIETDEEQMFLFELFSKAQRFGIKQAAARITKKIF